MENNTTDIINELATCLRIRKDAMWSIYYETGLDYLEQLKQRIKYASYLELQFGAIIRTGLLKIKIEDTFQYIERSKLYWSWWAETLLDIYISHKPADTTELSIKSMFTSDLIPTQILFKIFGNERGNQKESGNRKTANFQLAKTTCFTAFEA